MPAGGTFRFIAVCITVASAHVSEVRGQGPGVRGQGSGLKQYITISYYGIAIAPPLYN